MLEPFSTVELATVVFATLTSILGIFIAYQAYRGLRRNDSRPMWYLSTGLILLFGVTYVVSFVGQALITLRVLELPAQDLFRLMVRILQLSGVAMIAYSMRLAAEQRTSL